MTNYNEQRYEQKYVKLLGEIANLKKRLSDLDDDYNRIQECKKELALSSIYTEDLITQCGDIKVIFDRNTIQGNYNAYQISFNNMNTLFDNLDKIVSATKTFETSCRDIKEIMDEYGVKMDESCIDIAEKATEIKNRINELESQLSIIEIEHDRAWLQEMSK